MCSANLPKLETIEVGGLWLYMLPEGSPLVNTPVTVASAHVVRNDASRYATDDRNARYWESFAPRMPTRVLVADVFVREDTFAAQRPEVTTTLMGPPLSIFHPDTKAFRVEQVPLHTPMEDLGLGLERVPCDDITGYKPTLERVFGGLQWEPERFRGYRCRVMYPVPLVRLTYWFQRLRAGEL